MHLIQLGDSFSFGAYINLESDLIVVLYVNLAQNSPYQPIYCYGEFIWRNRNCWWNYCNCFLTVCQSASVRAVENLAHDENRIVANKISESCLHDFMFYFLFL